jgi:hypothetical protein
MADNVLVRHPVTGATQSVLPGDVKKLVEAGWEDTTPYVRKAKAAKKPEPEPQPGPQPGLQPGPEKPKGGGSDG